VRRAFIFLIFGMLTAEAAHAMDDDIVGPRAYKWGTCAIAALPPRAVRDALKLWNVRNDGHIDRANRIDAAGEARWFAQWRGFLRRKCGSLDPVRNEKFDQPHIPGAGLDEIYLIYFHGPAKYYPWSYSH
jgi:hypothetical protein